MSVKNREQAPRRQFSLAGRAAVCCGGWVLGVAVLCAFYSRHTCLSETTQRFHAEAARAVEFTTLALLQDTAKQPRELLRKYYQLETKRRHFDHLALIVGGRIAVAHSLDWEGLSADYATGDALGYLARVKAPRPGVTTVRTNEDLDRLEALVLLPHGDERTPVLLYLAQNSAAIRGAAWARFGSVLSLGSLLALVAGGMAYTFFRVNAALPLATLQGRIRQRGLEPKISRGGVGELFGLVQALETATQQLLKRENDKVEAVEGQLKCSEEQAQLEMELLQHLVRDLRAAMSGIMGYSDLLLTCDHRPSDRINHIRAIQHEARRIAHLVREIQELLSSWPSEVRSDDASGSISKLQSLIEKLAQSQAGALQIAPPEHGRSKLKAKTEEPAAERDVLESRPDARPIKTRLTGSILIYGRKDDITDALLKELEDVGLGAVLVPDKSGLENELSRGGHDLVLVNLSRGDRVAREMSNRVRESFPDGPIVAVLPGSTRGDGNKYVRLGFDDFFYTPITRQNILATIGKYLDFEPITTSTD